VAFILRKAIPTIPKDGLLGERQLSPSNSFVDKRQPLNRPSIQVPQKEAIRLDRFDNCNFDRGAGRIKEAVWMVVKAFLLQWHFPIPSKLRVLGLRAFGAKIGRGVVIRSGVNVTYPWRVTIGDHCWIGEDVTILSLDQVTIGDHCCLSQRAFLCTGSHDFRKESFDLVNEPIVIEPHCWIAASAFIGPGARVAESTMVKAHEVVSTSRFRAHGAGVQAADSDFDINGSETVHPMPLPVPMSQPLPR
jgi:putative colanic acid biosynthesis acetyltransferase WcaF